ncbi:MAG: HAD family hydrolase, partial [Oscillibacter sp.]
RNAPRPRLRETIAALHEMGMVQGVISNIISTTFVPRLLEDYGVAPYFCCVLLSSVTGIRKPDARIFELAAAASGVPLSQMAYVGDTLSRDVLGCRNAGVGLAIQIRNPAIAHRDAAFVGTGLAPDFLIADLAEIPGIIHEQNRKR